MKKVSGTQFFQAESPKEWRKTWHRSPICWLIMWRPPTPKHAVVRKSWLRPSWLRFKHLAYLKGNIGIPFKVGPQNQFEMGLHIYIYNSTYRGEIIPVAPFILRPFIGVISPPFITGFPGPTPPWSIETRFT